MADGIATVNGATIPANFSTAAGNSLFLLAFNEGTVVSDISASGTYDIGSGSSYPAVVAITGSDLAATISGGNIIDFAGSNDTVTASGTTPYAAILGSGSVLNEGAGPSTVFGATGAATVNAGEGSTTLSGGSGSLTFDAGTSSEDSVTGGSGFLSVTNASGSNNTLVGGSAGSIITLTGASTGDEVVGGPGVTIINAASTSGAMNIATYPNGNLGTLIGTLGSGADTVTGGSGHSVFQAGTGQDVFIFIAGHSGGAETILGFNGKDNIGFAGYPAAPTEAVGPLGDVMTLSDNTTITFAGIDHKLF